MILCGSVVEVTRAQAHPPLELRGDARLSSLPFPPSLSPRRFLRPIPPPSILLAFSPSRPAVRRLCRSCVPCRVSTLVFLSSIFRLPHSHFAAVLSSSLRRRSFRLDSSRGEWWRVFSLSLSISLRISPHLTSLHLTSLRLIPLRVVSFADPFLRFVLFYFSSSLLFHAVCRMPLPLHFHLTIILALQILLTPPRFREKLGLRGISRKLPLWN